jgi:hypothetical protein
VFHSLQEPHLPTHFGDSAPQFWQKKDVFVFDILSNLSGKFIYSGRNLFTMWKNLIITFKDSPFLNEKAKITMNFDWWLN